MRPTPTSGEGRDREGKRRGAEIFHRETGRSENLGFDTLDAGANQKNSPSPRLPVNFLPPLLLPSLSLFSRGERVAARRVADGASIVGTLVRSAPTKRGRI